MKICRDCKLTKSIDSFYVSKSNKDGLYHECKDCWKIRRKIYRQENLEKSKASRRNVFLKTTYGITLKEYNEMRVLQNDLCAICNKPETRTVGSKKQTLCLDHNHQTKLVRQLLCFRCNSALGLLKESIEILNNMIVYVNKHNLL